MVEEQGRSTRRLDARRNREAVIDAAITLLSEDPTAGMQEIADASGLGRTTVYRHFPSRDELFLAMLEHAVGRTWEVSEDIFAKDAVVEQTIRELSAAMVFIGSRYRFVLEHRNLTELQRSRQSSDNPLRIYFGEAQARGEIRGDIPLHWVTSSFQALSLAAIEDVKAGLGDDASAADLLAESLLALLLPPRDPATGNE